MRTVGGASADRQSGQSLIEAALVLPILLMIVLNAVNLGYFFIVALNLTVAPRTGVQYSIQGFDSSASSALPSAGPTTSDTSVSSLTYGDMNGAIPSSSGASMQICSKTIGISGSGASQKASCSSYGSASFSSPSADPEAPSFVLHQVDVSYTFSPLIPGSPFGLALLPTGVCTVSGLSTSCTFHTKMSMRAID
jgi:Flp pilus assembly protein TadG